MDDNENNLLCITVTGPNQDLREKVARAISVVLSAAGFRGNSISVLPDGAGVIEGPGTKNRKEEAAFLEDFVATVPEGAHIVLLDSGSIDDIFRAAADASTDGDDSDE